MSLDKDLIFDTINSNSNIETKLKYIRSILKRMEEQRQESCKEYFVNLQEEHISIWQKSDGSIYVRKTKHEPKAYQTCKYYDLRGAKIGYKNCYNHKLIYSYIQYKFYF